MDQNNNLTNQLFSNAGNSSSEKVDSKFNLDLQQIKKLSYLILAVITCYVKLLENSY